MPTADELLAALEGQITGLDETQSYFKGLIYGPSGVGKTKVAFDVAQAVTDPKKTILYVDSAEGFSTLNNHQELKTRTRRMKWQNIAQIETVAYAIQSGRGSFGSIGCLIFDEFSSMADSDLDSIVKERARRDPAKSPDEAKLPDMGAAGTRMRRLADLLVPLDLHIIFVAHERQDDNNVGKKKSSPAFMPKLGQKIKERMHLVARMYGEDVVVNDATEYRRIIQIQPTNTVDAKSRIGTLTEPTVVAAALPAGVVKWLASGGVLKSSDEADVLAPESTDIADDTETDDLSIGVEV